MQSRLIPSFAFENAKEALTYYQDVFGATDVYRFSPQPEQAQQFHLPAEADLDSMTIHGGFTVLGMSFQVADSFRGPVQSSNQVDMILDIDGDDAASVQAAEDFYQHLQASGQVTIDMPFAEQFWGGKMGHFTDKYGISWMLHVMKWSQIKDPNK
ncbi:VOC family protein [Levilactobacillus lanxiensis]|uniref:VOC family protein n=1 Tax=Levilactobacillus lanxiensis TaxID=2799568 RepID=A0ABW4D492_9LACO|nr:VOC family protein [Levilactobacillus lanxiensis]